MCNGGYEIYLDGERLMNITLPYRFAAVGYYDMYFYSTYGGFETQAHFEVELEVPVAEMEIATSNRIDEPFPIGSLTDDILVIEIPDRDYDVEIFTLDGTICRRLHLPSQQSRATLDLQWTKPGLYFVRFTHGLKSNVARFVRY